MNCRVPDFLPEDDTAVFSRRIPDSAGEDFVELLWQKGPFFRPRSPDLPHADSALSCRADPCGSSGVSSHAAAAPPAAGVPSTELFMEEDEMASWLYYPLGGDDDPGDAGGVGGGSPPQQPREAAAAATAAAGFEEYGYPATVAHRKVEVGGWAASGRPPLHPEPRGRSAGLAASLPPPPASMESTVVDSSATPKLVRSRCGAEWWRVSYEDVREEAAACEHLPSSSSGACCEGGGKAGAKAAPREDSRKRKARVDDDCDSLSEDGEFELESSGKRRDLRRSACARTARAAEVHNLSERRRRDRINEKMKALQQLIPRCNRSDKASMLDDAIEYIRSLQMQVQLMSMYYNMAPVMFPGVQQYMPSVGMGIPMGMGMGMGMGMVSGGLGRPMMPLPTLMPRAQMGANGAAHLSQGLCMRPVQAPAAVLADQRRLQTTSQSEPSSSAPCIRTPSAVQMPNLSGLCHQAHPQNRAVAEPGTSNGTNMPEKSKLGGDVVPCDA